MYKLGIHLKVKNINTSLSFYLAFGLKPCFAYGDKEFLKQFRDLPTASEKYRGVTFDVGGTTLEIADGHLAVKPHVFKETIASSKISAMLQGTSIRKIQEICRHNGIKITIPPKVYPWHTREMVVKDPDGFIIVFIEKLS